MTCHHRCNTLIRAILISSVAISPCAWAQTTLKLINEYPATSITAAADLQFAAAVNEQSKGTIKVETLQEKQNPYKGAEQVNAVIKEKDLMGTLFGGVLGNKDSLFLLSSLPFAAKDFKQAHALYSCAEPALQERVKALGAHLLYVTPWPPSGIWSVTPLANDTDVKALKIRTYDTTSKTVFERLGAQSVALPYSALAEKLAAGEVNAVLTSGDGGAGRKLWDHLPNFTAVSYSIPLSYTIINRDAWDQLSSDQQAILTQAAEKVSAASWAGVEQRIEANYARMREHKMTLNTTPSDSIMKSLKQAGDDETKAWLKANNLSEKEASCLSKTGT
ncbi:TRAP transporter substrate-binding protein [Bordetella tumulicola]|uniref:TRAP transporter substrate-binding protein n=1 Tax=Bordetella tumulicola TaxID=1649133 RepID=UPI0039F02714